MAYLTRRKRSWFAQVNRQGVRRSKSFPTRRAAEAWADELEATIIGGEDPQAHLTLGDLIDRYMREIGTLRPWGPSKTSALNVLKRSIGELTLPELTVQALTNHAVARALRGASASTITGDLCSLSGVLKTARILWRLPVAPNLTEDTRTILAQMRLLSGSRPRERTFGPAELVRLERAWDSPIPFDLVRFAVASCMRQGEILRLRWSDYNPTFRTIVVRDRKHPTAKDGNHQLVPLLGDAQAIIDRQPRSGTRIWPFDPKSLWLAWRRAADVAGLQDANFHDLRHTGITDMFREGWKINEVAVVSGHKTWASLKRYTHTQAADLVAIEDARRAARAEIHPMGEGVKSGPSESSKSLKSNLLSSRES